MVSLVLNSKLQLQQHLNLCSCSLRYMGTHTKMSVLRGSVSNSYCRITNHPKTQWLKNSSLFSHEFIYGLGVAGVSRASMASWQVGWELPDLELPQLGTLGSALCVLLSSSNQAQSYSCGSSQVPGANGSMRHLEDQGQTKHTTTSAMLAEESHRTSPGSKVGKLNLPLEGRS